MNAIAFESFITGKFVNPEESPTKDDAVTTPVATIFPPLYVPIVTIPGEKSVLPFI